MKVASKEFHDLMNDFDREFKTHKLDREFRIDFPRKIYYQNGETNNLFKAYLQGYSLAKSKAIVGELILEN